jgi:hypothetical protein
MQIIESSVAGVRSVRLTLAGDATQPTVTLFPMVHVGEAEFYRTAYDDAATHDVVLIEGVKSPITTRVTRSYRWIVNSRRLNLSLQPGYRTRGAEKVILADLSHEEFVIAWRRVPLWMRLFIYVGAPLMGLRLLIHGTREGLAKDLGLDDARSQQELINWSPETGLLDAAILDARDERLIACLSEQLADERVRSIAVVYGANHMRAVIRELMGGRRYRVAAADWRTVFDL